MIDWLIDWLIGWLIDWLVDWLIDYPWLARSSNFHCSQFAEVSEIKEQDHEGEISNTYPDTLSTTRHTKISANLSSDMDVYTDDWTADSSEAVLSPFIHHVQQSLSASLEIQSLQYRAAWTPRDAMESVPEDFLGMDIPVATPRQVRRKGLSLRSDES